MKLILNRTWISPAVFASFIVVSITGILLALHIKAGNIKGIHEWIGYVFALISLAHLLINRVVFITCFRKPSASFAVFACILLTAALGFFGGINSKHVKPHPLIQFFDESADGDIDASEIKKAVSKLNQLDINKDGVVSAEEVGSSLLHSSKSK